MSHPRKNNTHTDMVGTKRAAGAPPPAAAAKKARADTVNAASAADLLTLKRDAAIAYVKADATLKAIAGESKDRRKDALKAKREAGDMLVSAMVRQGERVCYYDKQQKSIELVTKTDFTRKVDPEFVAERMALFAKSRAGAELTAELAADLHRFVYEEGRATVEKHSIKLGRGPMAVVKRGRKTREEEIGPALEVARGALGLMARASGAQGDDDTGSSSDDDDEEEGDDEEEDEE